MARGLLVALVNVKEGQQEAFDKWYIQEHLDHTAQAPRFLSGNVYRFVDTYGEYPTKPPQYLAFYELDTDDHEAALEALHEYNSKAGGHGVPEGGVPAEFTAAGWYVFERSVHTKG